MSCLTMRQAEESLMARASRHISCVAAPCCGLIRRHLVQRDGVVSQKAVMVLKLLHACSKQSHRSSEVCLMSKYFPHILFSALPSYISHIKDPRRLGNAQASLLSLPVGLLIHLIVVQSGRPIRHRLL